MFRLPFCRFVNETRLKCVAPALPRPVEYPRRAEVEVEITVDGEHYTENKETLLYGDT